MLPMAIIGLVLIAAVAGGYYLYSSSQKTAELNRAAANTATAPNTNRAQPSTVNAPAGAQPPHIMGSPTAAVTVEEFADFQCPACASTHPTMKEIQSIYGNRIKFIFRQFPLAIPAHDKAYEAAIAAEAAGMQGKFWAFQDQLFTNQQAWSQAPNYKELWAGYAEKAGVDVAKFQSDASGTAAKQRVDQDLSRGRGMSVGSTPSIYINGRLVPSPQLSTASLRQLIDAELQRASAAPAATNSNASANTAAAGNSNTEGRANTNGK